MRRHIPEATNEQPRVAGGEWLDLDALATVEISSEDPAHPVEAALVGRGGGDGAGSDGWRASAPGEQTLRLRFDAPQRIRRIVLRFVESEIERTQEIAVSVVGPGDGASAREIRRQRWNFSPGGSTEETEDWQVSLDGITRLDLVIVPDVSGGAARASLASLRLA